MNKTIIPSANYKDRFKDQQYASPELLNPKNHVLVLIDHEGQMCFAMEGVNRLELRNNLSVLGHYTNIYDIPVVLSTIGEKIFAGPLFNEIRNFYPNAPVYDRTSMNLWEDTASREAILSYGKNRIVFAGLWTDVCLAFPVISALAAGFEVYFIADASGSVSKEAHDIAVQRMIQAGAVPLTTIAYISENIRDYGRKDNTDQNVGQLLHEGMIKYMNFGIGVDYADHMVQSYPYYKGFGKEA